MKHYIFALKPAANAHEVVTSVLHRTDQDWTTTETRKLQFAHVGAAIVVRTNQEPIGIPCKVEAVDFSNGQQLKILVVLPAQKRAREYRSVPAMRTRSEMIEYATALLTTHGVTIDAIDCKPADSVTLKKDKRIAVVSAMQVIATATITDSQSFGIAYDQGIGREKSLGFGMMMIKGV